MKEWKIFIKSIVVDVVICTGLAVEYLYGIYNPGRAMSIVLWYGSIITILACISNNPKIKEEIIATVSNGKSKLYHAYDIISDLATMSLLILTDRFLLFLMYFISTVLLNVVSHRGNKKR